MERLEDCQQTLRCVIAQAGLFTGDSGECFENIPVPDDLDTCEKMMIEIIKEHAVAKKYKDEKADFPNVPIYFAGWLGPYESAFLYLVENGLAKWCYEGWDQMIYFPDGGECQP